MSTNTIYVEVVIYLTCIVCRLAGLFWFFDLMWLRKSHSCVGICNVIAHFALQTVKLFRQLAIWKIVLLKFIRWNHNCEVSTKLAKFQLRTMNDRKYERIQCWNIVIQNASMDIPVHLFFICRFEHVTGALVLLHIVYVPFPIPSALLKPLHVLWMNTWQHVQTIYARRLCTTDATSVSHSPPFYVPICNVQCFVIIAHVRANMIGNKMRVVS